MNVIATRELTEDPTIRQLQYLNLTARGLTTSEIAQELHVSPKTVQNALDDARIRTGARNITHLVAICVSAGLIEYTDD